eukprot:scaffold77233_cov66-Phaeocystis_antarctica.AAC.2
MPARLARAARARCAYGAHEGVNARRDEVVERRGPVDGRAVAREHTPRDDPVGPFRRPAVSALQLVGGRQRGGQRGQAQVRRPMRGADQLRLPHALTTAAAAPAVHCSNLFSPALASGVSLAAAFAL